jgi:glycosyltransferase involved in cell wall biosynthesis
MYNSKKFIAKALESTFKQTLPQSEFETVVIDDGSVDGSSEIVSDIIKSRKTNIRLITQGNAGAIKAANTGAKEARGEYIIFLDSDDFFEPEILSELYKELKVKNAVFSWCNYYEDRNGEIVIWDTKKNIFDCSAGGILIKKSFFLELGGFDESLKLPEYKLLDKLQKGYKGCHVNKPLFTYVRHDTSLTMQRGYVKEGRDQLKDFPEIIKKMRTYKI